MAADLGFTTIVVDDATASHDSMSYDGTYHAAGDGPCHRTCELA